MIKRSTCSLIFLILFASTAVFAAPPIQHRLSGVVRAIDLEKNALTLEPENKDSPTEFSIVEGRTRLRQNKKPSRLSDLTVGQKVQLYYKRETGRDVATEVTWTLAPAAPRP